MCKNFKSFITPSEHFSSGDSNSLLRTHLNFPLGIHSNILLLDFRKTFLKNYDFFFLKFLCFFSKTLTRMKTQYLPEIPLGVALRTSHWFVRRFVQEFRRYFSWNSYDFILGISSTTFLKLLSPILPRTSLCIFQVVWSMFLRIVLRLTP